MKGIGWGTNSLANVPRECLCLGGSLLFNTYSLNTPFDCLLEDSQGEGKNISFRISYPLLTKRMSSYALCISASK